MSEPITEDEVQAAERRWAEEVSCWPSATHARFEANMHSIVVSLSTGLDLLLNPRKIRGFESASDELLSQVDVEASGYALHFPLMDEGIWLPSIYAEHFPKLRPVTTMATPPVHALAA
jgi:hypothetical protein